jgi:hypothetical protein
MTLNDKLLDGAIKLAFEDDYVGFTSEKGESDVSPALDRRAGKLLAAQKRCRLALKFSRLTAACLVLAICVSVTVWFMRKANADAPVYNMVTETEFNTLYIWFVCRDDNEQATAFIPVTAEDVLARYTMTGTYTTEFAHIEEYDNGNIRFEQTALIASSKTVINIKNAMVKNIVIDSYPAILVFGDNTTAIFWRDENNSYMLSGVLSSDDAMRIAREIK